MGLFPRLNSLPLLRIRNPLVQDGIVSIPTRGVRHIAFPRPLWDGFSKTLFGRDVHPRDLPTALRTLAREQPAQYGERLGEYLRTTAQSAVQLLQEGVGGEFPKDFGKEHRALPNELAQIALTDSIFPEDGGHLGIIINAHSMKNAYDKLSDHRLMHVMTSPFPLRTFPLKNSHYPSAYRITRNFDGTAKDVFRELFPEIVEHAVERYRQKGRMAGYQTLGASLVAADFHLVIDRPGFRTQKVTMQTTPVHPFDGLVDWTISSFKELPHAVFGISIHMGENVLGIVERLNMKFAPNLFNPMWRVGALLVDHFDQAGFDRLRPEEALLLDENFRETFYESVRKLDWKLHLDTVVMSALDYFGEAMRTVRLFKNNTAVTLDAYELASIDSLEAAEKAIRDGIERSRAENYTGAGGLEVADPNARVPSLYGSTTSGAVDLLSKEAPLLEPLRTQVEQIGQIADRIPWDYLRERTERYVRDAVNKEARELPDSLSKSIEELLEAVDTPEYRTGVADHLAEQVTDLLSANPKLEEIAGDLTERGLQDTVAIAVSDGVYARYADLKAGESLLRTDVERFLYQNREHQLEQRVQEIQQEQIASADRLQTTSREIEEAKRTREKLAKQLEREPETSEERERLKRLLDEVERQVERDRAELDRLQREHERGQREIEERKRETEELAERRKRREREAAERAGGVFHGDGRPR